MALNQRRSFSHGQERVRQSTFVPRVYSAGISEREFGRIGVCITIGPALSELCIFVGKLLRKARDSIDDRVEPNGDGEEKKRTVKKKKLLLLLFSIFMRRELIKPMMERDARISAANWIVIDTRRREGKKQKSAVRIFHMSLICQQRQCYLLYYILQDIREMEERDEWALERMGQLDVIRRACFVRTHKMMTTTEGRKRTTESLRERFQCWKFFHNTLRDAAGKEWRGGWWWHVYISLLLSMWCVSGQVAKSPPGPSSSPNNFFLLHGGSIRISSERWGHCRPIINTSPQYRVSTASSDGKTKHPRGLPLLINSGAAAVRERSSYTQHLVFFSAESIEQSVDPTLSHSATVRRLMDRHGRIKLIFLGKKKKLSSLLYRSI